MFMKLLPLLSLVIFLDGCGQSSSSVTSAPTSVAAAPREPEIVTGDERKKIVSTLTKGMEEERDKMEGISFYSTKDRSHLSSTLEAYISLPDGMMPLLRMKSTYYGDSWIFYDSIKIMADDVVIYDRVFKHDEVRHHNYSSAVWETADYLAANSELLALKAIANSKSATIRFSGRDDRHDHEITDKERKNLRQVISTYEQLTAQLQRPAA